jgi:hypothetical protein
MNEESSMAVKGKIVPLKDASHYQCASGRNFEGENLFVFRMEAQGSAAKGLNQIARVLLEYERNNLLLGFYLNMNGRISIAAGISGSDTSVMRTIPAESLSRDFPRIPEWIPAGELVTVIKLDSFGDPVSMECLRDIDFVIHRNDFCGKGYINAYYDNGEGILYLAIAVNENSPLKVST